MVGQEKNVVAVIHARGGSKRIPLKNIKLLDGKPLVTYMIEAALQAQLVDRVIVSSDHPEIIRISKERGAEVPFVRPADIAEDVPSEMVTQHAVRFLRDQEGYDTDIAVTIQPTTPFCRPEDIDGCVQTLKDSPEADSVISVNPVHERPEWMFMVDEDGLARNFLKKTMTGDIGVSQTLPRLYTPNGGIYATRAHVLFNQNSIFGKNIKLWVMPRERSVDIDEPIDFVIAETLAREFRKEGIVS